MQEVSLQLLNSGSFYDPVVTDGSVVYLSSIDGSSRFYNLAVTANGSVSGLPVLLDFDILSSSFFTPYVSYEQEIQPSLIDQLEVYSVSVSEYAIYTDLLDSEQFYDVSALLGNAVLTNIIESFEFFEPGLYENGIFADLLESFEVYPFLTNRSVKLAEFSDFQFYPSLLRVERQVKMELVDDGEFFDITIDRKGIVVSGYIDDLYMYPIRTRTSILDPIRFKKADTIYGGDITTNFISSSQSYYPKSSLATYDVKTDFLYSIIPNLVDRYIPSNEAVFSKTFYRAFYIQNDSNFLERTNIDFWIDGGSTYTIDAKKIFENRFLLEEEEERYGVLLDNREEIKNNGRSKTSMFNQMEVSYLLSETKNLTTFNPDGSGVGIDLRSAKFVPANTITRIPALSPGDYVGVYLKITTKFKPDFPIKADYSFFHLSYSTPSSGFRETYPGQLKVNNSPVSQLLPSIYMRVTTDYAGLKKHLDNDVEYLYSKYPPYFLSLEDIGRSR